ncbi:hypothetical protein N9924_00580 [bacterium]|nr:hypothetical protein [bacterium]
MALNARKAPMGGGKQGPQQEPIDAGSYPCRVVQVLDLGLQEQRPWQGEPKPPAHEIMITYEFLDEYCLDEDGEEIEDKPRWLSETFPLRNLDSELAKSTKRYYALDADEVHEGDFTALIGTPCNVVVVQNPGKGKNAGKIYNNIQAVSAMRPKEAKKAAPLVNPSKVLVLEELDAGVFFSLPQWLQDKIKGNLEYAGSDAEEVIDQGPPVKEEEGKAKKKAKKKAKPPMEEDGVDEVEDKEDDEGEW